jgi:hypothetical protein
VSVITTVEAVPSRIRLFFNFFEARPKGEDARRVEQMLSPEPLRKASGGDEAVDDGTARANVYAHSLNEVLNLGLVERVEGDKLRPAALAELKGPSADERLIEWIEPRLLMPEQAALLSQQNFAPALAWLLMQSPLHPIRFAKNVSADIAQEFGTEVQSFDLTNKERFQNLAYWAKYLGYATLVQERSVVPDPTSAIKRHLPRIFARSPELRVEDFLRELAALAPVFELGSVREELEGKSSARRAEQGSQRLSASTSLALRRLADAKVLELRELSDAGVRILSVGDLQQRVSHVALTRSVA